MCSRLVSGLVNGLLCGISSYGCYRIDPLNQPCGFASCIISCSKGIYGLLNVIYKVPEPKFVTKGQSKSILQVGHISLINLGLYKRSGITDSTIIYGLCLAPLIYCMAIGPEKNIWLDLITVLNIISLLHLTRGNGSWSFIVMAYLALLSTFGTDYMNQFGYRNIQEPIKCLSMTAITLMGIKALK